MSTRLIAAALAGAFLLPAAASAQSRVNVPEVTLFATVTGKWVLDPRRCPDIREDVRDARKNTGRRDRREDRRDQRIVDCPASAYDFVVAPGQGPRYPVRVGEGRIPREYQGRVLFTNGGTVGEGGRPVEDSGGYAGPYRQPQPTYPRPTYTPPTYTPPTYARPTYTAPTYTPPTYTAPTYQQPTYQQPSYTQPAYRAPAPAPSQPSNYEIRNGVIYFTD